jgi:hypothetical protein
MSAWRYFWERLFRGVHGKRLFAVDAEAYRALRLAAAQQQRSPQEFAASLFTQAAREQSRNAQVMQLWAQLTPRQQQVCAYVLPRRFNAPDRRLPEHFSDHGENPC